jgi:hypothetical protein
MFAFSSITSQGVSYRNLGFALLGGVFVLIHTTRVSAQQAPVAVTAREILGPSPFVPVTDQPEAKLIIDPPLPDQLAQGRVVIQYRTEHLRVVPVFGPAAAAVSPRIGHLHVTLDDLPWHWAHTSGEELILNGLPSGPHKLAVELADADHNVLAEGVARFDVPKTVRASSADRSSAKVTTEKPAAKIIVNPPLPEPLARGVALLRYRTENLQVMPVYGPAAATVLPRIGHIHVTVDDVPWHWADASGGPVIVADLAPGPHKIAIDLVDPNHQPLSREVIEFVVPQQLGEAVHGAAKTN